jgi:hypothetical protein
VAKAADGLRSKQARRAGGAASPEYVSPGGSGGVTVNFNGDVFGADSDELARRIRVALARMARRGDSLGF